MLAAVKGERVPSKDAIVGSGSFSGPCIPDLAEHYFEKLSALLALSSVSVSLAQRKSLRATFVQRVTEAYADTPYARFVVAYQRGAPVY